MNKFIFVVFKFFSKKITFFSDKNWKLYFLSPASVVGSHKNQVIVVDYLLLGSVSKDKYYTFSTKRPFKRANIWLFSARRDCLTPCDADWAQASSIIIGGQYSRGGPPPPKNYSYSLLSSASPHIERRLYYIISYQSFLTFLYLMMMYRTILLTIWTLV